MKLHRIFPFAFSLLLLILLLPGCDARTDSSDGMQTLYNQSAAAEKYVQKLFRQRMEALEYVVDQTAYGFITDETPIYVVGYLYHTEEGAGKYGYKLEADQQESDSFVILEEGEAVAEFLFSP